MELKHPEPRPYTWMLWFVAWIVFTVASAGLMARGDQEHAIHTLLFAMTCGIMYKLERMHRE